ncbi:MAG: hydrogenase nickel incorporation protein HypB [Alphaproteobacteria bacterium]|jgi:hydrogenase nickel incorporation protein HypB|nr:hydrogenase nickel incorporation protein HypB [Alphaproteobacteria bacterium]
MCGTCGCPSHQAGGAGRAEDPERGRVITLERDLLAANDAVAARNRERLAAADTLAVNLMAGPGAGKTTLLVATITALAGGVPVAVVEGDQATDLDAARIRATGVPARQITTGKACHLDAAMIARALDDGIAPAHGVLFVENVGNLVCPAGFDLGEAAKVVVASVPEGDDKPLKYPDIFAAADLVLVNKCDLLAHVAFDLERFTAAARRLAPAVAVLAVSATSGAGLGVWLDWLARRRARLHAAA